MKGRFVKAEIAASIASKVSTSIDNTCALVPFSSITTSSLQEVTVAGAYVPPVRHEHKVERLLSLRAEGHSPHQSGRSAKEGYSPHQSGRSASPALSERSRSVSSQKRSRSASVGLAEDIYARSYLYSSRRQQTAAAAQQQQQRELLTTNTAAATLDVPSTDVAGRKRPRSKSFHS